MHLMQAFLCSYGVVGLLFDKICTIIYTGLHSNIFVSVAQGTNITIV